MDHLRKPRVGRLLLGVRRRTMPTQETRSKSRPTLEQAYRDAGMPITDRDNLQGFAGYTDSGRAVVYTLPTRTVTDPVACTLGHEVMHIAPGDYHK